MRKLASSSLHSANPTSCNLAPAKLAADNRQLTNCTRCNVASRNTPADTSQLVNLQSRIVARSKSAPMSRSPSKLLSTNSPASGASDNDLPNGGARGQRFERAGDVAVEGNFLAD